jgi:hypothetical protein
MKSLLTVVIAVSALGATPPPPDKRVSVIIVPMDGAAESLTLKLEGYANDALTQFQGLSLKTSDELFGIAPDEDAVASLKRAEQGFNESKTSFDARTYDDAERKLRATIKEYGKAVAAMKGCGNLCESVAMYATVLQARGDLEESKIAILDLISLSPTFELDHKRYPQNFLALKAQVATSRNAQLRGNVSVKSKPAGARVQLNGEFQCFTPCSLNTLPIGKQLIRIERPGYRQVGQLVEVSVEDQDVSADLVPTSGYKAFDGLKEKLAGEALRDKGGSAMTSVSNSLKLDRAVIGLLKDIDGTTELTLGYYDIKAGKRFAIKKASFQGDEFGQLKGEIARMVNALVNYDNAEKVSRSSDPLDGRHGMEEWNADDKGGRNKERDKKKTGKDPLEGVNGTEDW